MKSKLFFFVIFLNFSTYAQNTLIPDRNFENKLVALGIDSENYDGQVLTSAIDTITSLNISDSEIGNLTGIQDFTALTSLNCSYNKLPNLDLSKNIFLTSLDCSSNQLTNLDLLAANRNLTSLNCSSNQLTSLDISNTVLISLNCSSNQLINLNLRNGNKGAFNKNAIDFKGNTNLTCILVDDVIYSNENWTNAKDTTATYATDCTTYTSIPDENFEKTLIALGIDSGIPDGKVLTSNVSIVTTLDVSDNEIKDLTGIQDFVNLIELNCYYNKLQTLDLSKNTKLTDLDCTDNKLKTLSLSENTELDFLDCSNNKLETLDVSKNTKLRYLGCSKNRLTTLDVLNTALTLLYCVKNRLTSLILPENEVLTELDCNTNQLTTLDLSKNTKLRYLDCSKNQLITLDISKNTENLTDLYCQKNQLITLDASNNTKLNILSCSKNQLTTLDLSKNINLTYLYCEENQLNSLDISKNETLTDLDCSKNKLTTLNISNNKALIYLQCDENQLTALDVSKNVNLNLFSCASNQLISLNLKNGNNTALDALSLNLKNNENLTCILVDNAEYSNTNWTDAKDTTASYNINDCTLYTNIPDANFESELIALGYDSGDLDGKVITANIASVTSLNVSHKSITNLEGIQDFIALTELNCAGNQLTALDLSKNVNLNLFSCASNQLISLNLKNGNNTALDALSLNLKNNENLTCILVDNAEYSNTNWTDAKDTTASYNINDCTLYTNIPDANFESELIALGIDSGILDGKVITANIASVTSLNVSYKSITNLEGIQDFIALTELNCAGNQLTALDVSKNVALTYLDCYNNQLKSLDTSNNVKLDYFDCSENQLTSLDISKNVRLNYVYCFENQLTSLDVSKNVILNYLYCSKNQLINLDLSKNNNLILLDCSLNKLSSLNLKNINDVPLIDPYNINFKGNEDLTCILVDDIEYCNTYWMDAKDTSASYATECEAKPLDNTFAVKLQGGETNSKNIVGLQDNIIAYPNPTSDNFEIQLLTLKKEVTIELYSLYGQLISNKIYVVENGKAQLTLENQPVGIYIAKVTLDQPVYLKIIKSDIK